MPPQILAINILTTISIALAQITAIRDEVDHKYTELHTTMKSDPMFLSCLKHINMSQGSIESDYYSNKTLCIMLAAESKPEFRKCVLNWLKYHFPNTYKAARKQDPSYLLSIYTDLREFLSATYAEKDRAIYFYISLYCTPNGVDEDILHIIVKNVYTYEEYAPINMDIIQEQQIEERQIMRLNDKLHQKYDHFHDYSNIKTIDAPEIQNLCTIYDNLFHIEKFDVYDLLYNHINFQPNSIYLAILNGKEKILDTQMLMFVYISCTYIHSLLLAYKDAKHFFHRNCDSALEDRNRMLEKENEILRKTNEQNSLKIAQLKEEAEHIRDLANRSKEKQESVYLGEIAKLTKQLSNTENLLSKEKKYRVELNHLREFIFTLSAKPEPTADTACLSEVLTGKKVFIIGGPKHWRRRLRDSYPNIYTLNGTTTYFDISILNQADCVIFYTRYLNHANYNRAMNYIRNHNIHFGYINTANLSLVEHEIIEVLSHL